MVHHTSVKRTKVLFFDWLWLMKNAETSDGIAVIMTDRAQCMNMFCSVFALSMRACVMMLFPVRNVFTGIVFGLLDSCNTVLRSKSAIDLTILWAGRMTHVVRLQLFDFCVYRESTRHRIGEKQLPTTRYYLSDFHIGLKSLRIFCTHAHIFYGLTD